MEDESLDQQQTVEAQEDIWVFGYGSILWNPGFTYESCRLVYVEGYARQLWQGNTSHRGTPELSRTWGMAYHVVGEWMIKACLEHLGVRECQLGGYTLHAVTVTQSDASKRLHAVTFIALPSNRLYLGPASVDDMAQQVVNCRGFSGTNAEYVTRLADFVRQHMPDVDHELCDLDVKVRQLLAAQSRSPVTDILATSVVEQCEVAARDHEPRRNSLVSVLAG